MSRDQRRLAGGQPTSVWYDRRGGFEPHHPEITPTVERSAARMAWSGGQGAFGGVGVGGAVSGGGWTGRCRSWEGAS